MDILKDWPFDFFLSFMQESTCFTNTQRFESFLFFIQELTCFTNTQRSDSFLFVLKELAFLIHLQRFLLILSNESIVSIPLARIRAVCNEDISNSEDKVWTSGTIPSFLGTLEIGGTNLFKSVANVSKPLFSVFLRVRNLARLIWTKFGSPNSKLSSYFTLQ